VLLARIPPTFGPAASTNQHSGDSRANQACTATGSSRFKLVAPGRQDRPYSLAARALAGATPRHAPMDGHKDAVVLFGSRS